ncbi:hypothetical protein [Cohaesibacter marisflavi]|uniref:hypothetical protein n=1 Tax=Cohaesibacter marisflavi TaxID=655353 RepID=UPI00158703D7|nr:hypothetical protein [Cohaesibacter marisflavi]
MALKQVLKIALELAETGAERHVRQEFGDAKGVSCTAGSRDGMAGAFGLNGDVYR